MQTLVQASKDQGEATSATISELHATADKWKRSCQDAEEAVVRVRSTRAHQQAV